MSWPELNVFSLAARLTARKTIALKFQYPLWISPVGGRREAGEDSPLKYWIVDNARAPVAECSSHDNAYELVRIANAGYQFFITLSRTHEHVQPVQPSDNSARVEARAKN